MRVRVSRLAAHQNAKVFSVMAAIGSLFFVLPAIVAFGLLPPGVDSHGDPIPEPPMAIFVLFPLVYLFGGYLFIRMGCALYNWLYAYIGGFEYEIEQEEELS